VNYAAAGATGLFTTVEDEAKGWRIINLSTIACLRLRHFASWRIYPGFPEGK